VVTDDELAGGSRRSAARVDPIRASVVVVCFLVALGLLLGPASNLVGGAPSRTTTTTLKPPPPINRARVLVQVANGTAVSNLAGTWTTPLNTLNWDVLPPVDAARHWTRTTIYYAPGFRRAGELLATELSVPRSHVVPLVPRTKGIGVAGSANDDVVIIIGVHHAGQGVKTI
jgi:hypothetical protein